jgi:large conductance mechanosensitive channel
MADRIPDVAGVRTSTTSCHPTAMFDTESRAALTLSSMSNAARAGPLAELSVSVPALCYNQDPRSSGCTDKGLHMGDLLREFKTFVNRGNLVELAVAFTLTLFFVPVVNAIVDGVILNLIAAIFGQPNFDAITIGVGEADLLIGTVITALVTFLIVAFVCFLIVKAYNAFYTKEHEEDELSEIDLLTEIRDELRSRRP